MTAPDIDEAYRHCLEIARGHYENFPTASLLLKAKIRPAVGAVYAFARRADDFADEPEHAGRRDELLDECEKDLAEALAGRPRGPVFVALADAVERFNLPVQPLRDLLDAFRQDVHVTRYESFADVLDYCRRSANPVGRLVLALHDVRDAESLAASDAICSGLQLTNFWQDVGIDLDKDRVYLPRENLRSFLLSEQELFARDATPAFRRLLAFQVERTRELFARGWPLVRGTRGRLGLWLRLVWGGGHGILDAIDAAGHDVFRHRPVLGARDWLPMVLSALLGRARRPRLVGGPA